MSDEIAEVVEQDVAQPMLKAVEDIGESVPGHFEGIGERLEGTATAHVDNESGIRSEIEGVNPQAAQSGVTGAPGSLDGGRLPAEPSESEPLGPGDPVTDAQAPGGQGASDDPVDLVSGEMFLPQRDLALPAVLALVLERTHRSGYRRGRWFGRSWASSLDQRVEVDDDGIHYAAPDGVVLHYPVPRRGQETMPAEGARWPLRWDERIDTIRIRQPELGRTLHFPPGPTPAVARPLAALTDRNGNRITFVHDGEGVPTDVYHSGGYHILVDRDFTGGRIRVSGLSLADHSGGPAIAIRRFGYDRAGRLTELTDSSGLPQIYEYDDQDRMTSWTDRNGHRYEYHYGQDGRVVRSGGTGGCLAAAFAYDLEARVTVVTDSLGHATAHHWNTRGQVVKVVDPLGGVTLFEQDRFNRRLSRTDPLGHTTRYELGEHGDPTRVERPDGTTILTEYGDLRLPTRVTGPDAAVWCYGYDAAGNTVSVTDPEGAATRIVHDEHGAPISITDALGGVMRYENNPAGLPVSVTDPLGGICRIAYDGFGRVVEAVDPDGGVTRTQWSVEGLPLRREMPDGTRHEWAYDAEGNLLEHRNPVGAVLRCEYGTFDRVVSRTAADGGTYRFGYDTELRLTSVAGPDGATWRYQYGPTDALVSETDYNGRTLTYRHDAAGRLVERVNGAGESIAFTRDALGRVVVQQAGAESTRFTYDPAGRVLRAEASDCVVEWVRDSRGRVLSESVDGRTLTATLTAQYDSVGRRVSRTTSTGTTSAWTFNAAGLPLSLATTAGGLTFHYDAAGRETARFVGAGAALTQSWDGADRLTGQSIWSRDTASPAADGADSANSADGAGYRRISARTIGYRADGSPVETADEARGTSRLELDAAGRVIALDASAWREEYAYDELGNLSRAGWPAADDLQGEREYRGTLVRRVGRAFYEHDAQGRVVRCVRHTLSGQTRTWTYEWDAYDRLTGITTPEHVRWRYLYDPVGRRIAKQRLGADGAVDEEIRFSWEGSRLAEQVVVSGDRTTVSSWDWEPGGFRVAAQTTRAWTAGMSDTQVDTAFHAVITDLVGTPRELVAPDGRVALVPAANLWGAPAAATDESEKDCPLRFPGQYRDAESGLHYNLLRYYDPGSGGYLSPDPLGLSPGPNPHAYVENPLTWVDPFGLAAYREFAHGTLTSDAQNIVDNGLSETRAQATSYGGAIGRPGSLFTYQVSGGSDPAFSTAAQWGVTRNGGVAKGASVIVGRLPESTYQDLLQKGLITLRTTGQGMPEETVFAPAAFATLNQEMQWVAKVDL